MSSIPNLRIIVDGDHRRVYRRGEEVTGRVILVTTEQEDLKSLAISFNGSCTTRTSRPNSSTETDVDSRQGLQSFEEQICLFNFKQNLILRQKLIPGKYCWTFNFKFPDQTEPKFARWYHGPKYHRDPHPLPPTFHTQTHMPGGQAVVSYVLEARLDRSAAQSPLLAQEPLPYHPTPHNMTLDARIVSRVLYAQTWKPLGGRTAIDKALKRFSKQPSATIDAPRIVPTLHYPERISPGQHIPLMLSLTNSEDPSSAKEGVSGCVLDSVIVTITTHTTSMCSKSAIQSEDVMIKHVVCLSKANINTAIPFGTRTKLTNNFRLIDDVECVPSFKTYTITRRYDLTIVVGISYGDRSLRIRCTTLLDILPRIPRELLPSPQEDDDAEIEPLPLYMPREPSAPDYESLYSLSRTPSSSRSSAYTRSGSTSSSVASSGQSTPASEIDEPEFLGAANPIAKLEANSV